jgi:hypothetical protein
VNDAFSRMANPSAQPSGSYWDQVTNVTKPESIPLDMAARQTYELVDLANNKSVTLHYWSNTTATYSCLTSLTQAEYDNRQTTWSPTQRCGSSSGWTFAVHTVNKLNGDINILSSNLGTTGVITINGQTVQ